MSDIDPWGPIPRPELEEDDGDEVEDDPVVGRTLWERLDDE